MVYEGGRTFINEFLRRYSDREDFKEYVKRKEVSYNPGFGTNAINEVRNTLIQRLTEIKRAGGSSSYQACMSGKGGGVDLEGHSMLAFLGVNVIPELLVMGRVGIYVDMPPIDGVTLADFQGVHPYLYKFNTEDIVSWNFDNRNGFYYITNALLREFVYIYDEDTGLTSSLRERFRHIWMSPNKETGENEVFVQFYNDASEKVDVIGHPSNEPVKLGIKQIPFVILELSNSLMVDIADYQIGLLNLASSDLSFILKANMPLYTEQYDSRAENIFTRQAGLETGEVVTDDPYRKGKDVDIGSTAGRRYPLGADRPGYIAPPSEPLRISMEKQQKMKDEIRQLVHLGLSNMTPRMASADSKSEDRQTLETGLAAIGLELCFAEKRIAEIWSDYEGNLSKGTTASVYYPEKYDLRSEEERRKDAEQLKKLRTAVPSKLFNLEVAKQIAESLLGNKIDYDLLQDIYKEIDDAKVISSDPEEIIQDVEWGLVDLETASEARFYPKGSAEKAKKDHADRLARIAVSQSTDVGTNGNTNSGSGNGAARGITDQASQQSADASKEKTDSKSPDRQAGETTVKDRVRGAGATNKMD